MTTELTANQQEEIQRLKRYFPYRLIFTVVDKDTGVWEAHPVQDMRIPNKLTREGHQVYIVK